MAVKKGGLGKGLSAIFMENESEDSRSTVTLKISELQPNREQPRREFDEKSLVELADSISQHGILQPLLVRPFLDGGYQIVAGERRYRAARMAGLTEVPVVIRDLSDSETMQLALIENLQREDLTPVEEAKGYKQLMDSYGLKQEEVSRVVGKSRPAIANALRLLALPDDILQLISDGKLSAGHGRTLLAFKNPDEMEKAARLASTEDISVRELERLAKKSNKALENADVKKIYEKKLSYYGEVELALKEHLGRKIKVNGTEKKGVLEIEFYGKDDLTYIAKLLGQEEK
ncbi:MULTISPECIES: ParB/RepB/Spo0J family partition protein [unclassified Ruminococcus]|uniref:ParB/RepB/Spo0J family partition protein n=1 Tax=unclassified Ruminococcus TaxID=2608920 RepID=UPI00210D84C0|nr:MULTISPECIES: ParB/RepB/Spo0J family partition protein [unclassified Ruminococcus]MCQ4021950.1 ParB/RepB/Spo0J family partition protein [Ruminococcus sp. zg-924]MCQ4114486.1 ParB/RepB/Spo0J family partition protein [Ruminococcus sp. zg-921]